MRVLYVVAISLFLFLLGCSDESNDLRKDFLTNCQVTNIPRKGCVCLYEQIAKNYSDEQIKTLIRTPFADKSLLEKYSNDVIQFAAVCARQ
ncbi:hypothetical protein MTZ49_04720 [Entomomonas sp. E2T0]|uniref:hypothetical protein n=1 Tax=Entomomonas sp. E2T0 TaxID=2930213 RepID=UPI00222836BC|nr:hypothetical protein [Entomomonas sp. E2T0]UYZ84874.1 hypothetical protein MTZ49_04720 [Entomomonas sp. E2T0]